VDSLDDHARNTVVADQIYDASRRLSRTTPAAWSVDQIETILIEKVQSRTRADTDRMKKIYGIFNDGFQDVDSPGHAGIDKEEFAAGLRGPLGIPIPVTKCNALFRKIDNDGSGSISLMELNEYLFMKKRRVRAVNPDAVNPDVLKMKGDGGGKQGGAVKKLRNLLIQNKMRPTDLFKTLDINHDQQISAQELNMGLRRYGIALQDFEVNEIIQEFDTDGDGEIDELEFVCGISKKNKRRNMGTDTTIAPVHASKRGFQIGQMEPTNGNYRGGKWTPQMVAQVLKAKVMNKTRHDQDRMRLMYFYFNEDGASGIDPEEFAYGLRVKMNISVPNETCFALFRMIDTDGGGIIELHELNRYLFHNEDNEGGLGISPHHSRGERGRSKPEMTQRAARNLPGNVSATTFSSMSSIGENSFSLHTPPRAAKQKKRFAWN
jgi:Ca2+-binding EF-hand superfamily protein